MPTLLLIGASRGLGLALAAEYLERGWRVVATVRGEKTGLHDLAAASQGRLEIETLDIVDTAGIAALSAKLAGRSFDALFVNAGVANDPRAPIGEVAEAEFTRVMVTNAYAPMRVIEAFAGLVAPGGVIGAMSSGLGSVANNVSGGWEAYRASKAALNTLMRSFSARPAQSARPMVVIAPGWVRTDMGGPAASLGVDESIPGVVDAIASRAGKPGIRYLDYRGAEVAW